MIQTHQKFFLSISILIIILGGALYYQEKVIRNGEITILKTRPIDPRDLLRGEYVTLHYEIENDKKVAHVVSTLHNNTKLYIKLSEDTQGIAHVESATAQKPYSLDGLWIVGEVHDQQVHFPALEQFYVPEGAGESIESLGSGIHSEITLTNGTARVIKLLDNSLNPIDPELYIKTN